MFFLMFIQVLQDTCLHNCSVFMVCPSYCFHHFLIEINILVNKVQFKSIKGKKPQIFAIAKSSEFTRRISMEHKQTSYRDSTKEMFTSFLHSEVLGIPRAILIIRAYPQSASVHWSNVGRVSVCWLKVGVGIT